MKAKIHPQWYPECRVSCACGNTFTLGASVPEMTVDVCSACHPFYTGQMKYIDTQGRVESFKAKRAGAKKKILSKTEKRRIKRERRIKAEMEKPESLEELRQKEENK